ncbi:amidohydrolase family protein [Desulfovibrio sp. OttesenSCG-928-O18]|nr:amidohydrolase family protein [Desulfovibrio sp. OttesenSCG-928-O18]
MSRKTETSTPLAVRARTILPLAGERPARGMSALCAPLERIDDGVLVARDGVILDVLPYKDFHNDIPLRDLGDVTLAPGLVNCHTHLELSHMHGGIAPGQGFHQWLKSLVALDRKASSPDAAPALVQAMSNAMAAMAESGVFLAGDISSRMPRTVLETARHNGLDARVFLEVIGRNPALPEYYAATAVSDPDFSLAGHAFYTTPGEAMQRVKAWCDAQQRPFSMHLAEHEAEEECLLTGQGEFCDLMRGGMLPEAWRAPGMRPVQYAASLGLLSPGTLAVHCVRCNAADIATLAGSGTAVCLCPRSNAFIGVGEAPAAAFAEQGALLCLGTDSLASNTDLCLWSEAEYFLQKNILPANALLRMATVNGAAVLGRSVQYGRLARGARFCYTVFPSETITLFR